MTQSAESSDLSDPSVPAAPRVPAAIPARAGIGLRGPHYREVLRTLPAVGWMEVHSENHFGDGGAPLQLLESVREHYPLSLHGIGLSLGSADPMNQRHLQRLSALVDRFEPGLVSDHLCWSSVGGTYLNDLLPLPYTEEALDHVSRRIVAAQETLRRQILVENVSSYLTFEHSTITEWEFLAEVAERADCGILLDVNNIYVSSRNHGFDPERYLEAIPAARVHEIHLAGFAVNHYDEGDILIDNHGARVSDDVWALYARAVERFGDVPSLIEWDTDIPDLDVLIEEAHKADAIRERHDALVA